MILLNSVLVATDAREGTLDNPTGNAHACSDPLDDD
jgi:hypothetical protein